MDPFYYQILHTPKGAEAARQIRALIAGDPQLGATATPWTRTRLPSHADLFALLVIATDDVGQDDTIRARVQQITDARFPSIPVVESCKTYDFKHPPLPSFAPQNAVGLDDPQFIVDTLLRHAGLRRFGTGGQVFISYARSDGTPLADALKAGLADAGFRAFIDRHEIEGGVAIQSKIAEEIGKTDLVILIDSKGAAASPWVEEEMDLARAAHVPVIAVTPTQGAFRHAFPAPHVPWDEPDVQSVVANVVAEARRILARKLVFRERVARALAHISSLRGWHWEAQEPHWIVRPPGREVHVSFTEVTPEADFVQSLRDRLGDRTGLLIGGTRPYPPKLVKALAAVGGATVSVATLSRAASKIPAVVNLQALKGKRVFLSAAMPDAVDAADAAHTLAPFVVTFIQTMVDLGATVVFGGHPTVVPLVSKAIVQIAAEHVGAVELHLAKSWVLQRALPQEAQNRAVFRAPQIHGTGADPIADVAALRDAMIRDDLHAAVFVGGKTKDYIGHDRGLPPGIVDEYQRFRHACPDRPAFVLGLAGGAAAKLIAEGQPPSAIVTPLLAVDLATTTDPDIVTALIVAELLELGR